MKIDLNGGRERIDPAPINILKVIKAIVRAIEIVARDSEDYSRGEARELFFDLSNDERILFQDCMKTVSPEGTRKTYYSCFKDHMELEK